jgi:hypothetical protein
MASTAALVGRLFLAAPAQPCRIDRRTLGHAHNLEGENPLEDEVVRHGNRRHYCFSFCA